MAANISLGKLERGKTIVNYVQTITLKSRLHEKALQVTIFSTLGIGFLKIQQNLTKSRNLIDLVGSVPYKILTSDLKKMVTHLLLFTIANV